VQVIDSHLMCKPRLFSAMANAEHAGKYPYPSPFFDPALELAGQGGTVSFGTGPGPLGFALDEVGTQKWTSPVTYTCINQGSWSLRFSMTVAITRGSAVTYRVFTFDPECQIGTGALPPT
jgi:hypothetical protein